MSTFQELSEQIKTLKAAREWLQQKYDSSEFHKKKEDSAQSAVPPLPEDQEIYKLLTAIQQLDKFIKELQDEQFAALKEET